MSNDGVQMEEMQGYRENLINKFVNEGYNREEATRIYEYMVNEDRKLTEEQAKEKVNEEIRNIIVSDRIAAIVFRDKIEILVL